MVAELINWIWSILFSCSLAKISMVAEHDEGHIISMDSCSLAKISMVAELESTQPQVQGSCSLAKISMVAEPYSRRNNAA